MEVGLLGVAADQIAGRLPATSARHAPPATGSARARRGASSAERRAGGRVELEAGRVAPAESPAARGGTRRRPPTCALRGSLARARPARNVVGVVQSVANEVALGVARSAGDAPHDADRRGHGRRQVVLEAGDGLVDVERELRRVERGPRRVCRQTGDGAGGPVERPRPARSALEREVVEHGAQVVDGAPRHAP